MDSILNHLRTFSKINRGIFYCNAAPSSTIIQPLDKGAFLKLQNGSDIRGVAVDGVESEPVSLTEPVTEAIAAAFAAWLQDKKKSDASRRLKVSIGHDSRISAQKLQDAVSRGLTGAGVVVIQYGLASTPAVFNSTLTKSEEFLCQVDGSIMITAKASGVVQGSKVLTDMVDGLDELGFSVELRLKIDQNHSDLKGRSFHEYGEAVLYRLSNITDSDPKLTQAPVNYEGVRVSGYGGWFLLRLSLHDPVLPLNIEAPSNEEAAKLGLIVLSAVREFQAIDTSALDKFIQV